MAEAQILFDAVRARLSSHDLDLVPPVTPLAPDSMQSVKLAAIGAAAQIIHTHGNDLGPHVGGVGVVAS